MTKQEVKDEFKQTEGNPEIKGRIRRIQRQMALSRMMQKVPQADVIVRNPTHYAVALKYDPSHHGAPVVLAKGQDELALRIVRVGEENGVYITENKPLARALYASCELDRLCVAALEGSHFIKGYMEYLGSGDGMDVLGGTICFDQPLIP